ncbi:Rieske 2Fe-2S domain-containing protein [Halovibrio variabilis]|uniref:Rieske 2Fe-2S domain-containing protein n=1 Tax=Halovibrio variabilis TaxID=31910 RepID=UPI0011BE303B
MSYFHTFDRHEGQLLTVGRQRYFIFRSGSGIEHMIQDKCPHRGGPLSRGRWDPVKLRLECPWHKSSWPEKTLIKMQLPTIKVNSRWTVYLGLVDPGAICHVHDIPVATIESVEHGAPTSL